MCEKDRWEVQLERCGVGRGLNQVLEQVLVAEHVKDLTQVLDLALQWTDWRDSKQ